MFGVFRAQWVTLVCFLWDVHLFLRWPDVVSGQGVLHACQQGALMGTASQWPPRSFPLDKMGLGHLYPESLAT